MQNKVKIIAGKLKGRNIKFDGGEDLRPTLGRVRETMFAWLDQDIYGVSCLDLFAGSGAMGFEAYSRGAKTVLMVESNVKAARFLRRNSEDLGCDGVSIVHKDYASSLDSLSKYAPFDIVFIDPPYDKYSINEILIWLDNSGIIASGSQILCEWHLQSSPSFPIIYRVKKLKKAGKVNYALLVYDNLGK